MEEEITLKQVAYHEAGHAFIQCYMKLDFEYVDIILGKDRGKVHRTQHLIDDLRTPNGQNTILKIKVMVIDYSGHAAEYRLTGIENVEGARNDYDEASDFAFQLKGKNEQAAMGCKDRAKHKAKRLVDYFWNDISHLAEILLQQKKMTYKQVKDAICSLHKETAP